MGSERMLRAYARASDRRRRAFNVLNARFDGVWLGLLDRDALDRLDEHFYGVGHDEMDGRVLSYRDEAHNRSGLHDWDRAPLPLRRPRAGQVVAEPARG